MRAMIMAAGEGVRLRPLTHELPKPMMPIVNHPVLAHLLPWLARHGFREIVINLHHLPEPIISYFGDGSAFGVSLSYSHEDQLWGTAGGVKRVADFLRRETFLVMGADDLTDMDLSLLLRLHRERKALASLAAVEVEDTSQYGIISAHPSGRIQAFLEKPAPHETFSHLANTQVYLFEPALLDFIPEHTHYDFSRQVFPRLLEAAVPFYAFCLSGYWKDIGSPRDYLQTHHDALEGRIALSIPGTAHPGKIWIQEGSEIHPAARIVGPAVVGRGCRIEAGAQIGPAAAIGDNCCVPADCQLSHTLVWSGVNFCPGTVLSEAIVTPRQVVQPH